MDNKNLKILFAGDFCAKNPEKIEVSEELRSIINSCDIKVLNFEGPLALGEPQIIKGSALLPQSELSQNGVKRTASTLFLLLIIMPLIMARKDWRRLFIPLRSL